MDDDRMKKYLELRLKNHCGHREASRLAGYAHNASGNAVKSYKFILNSKPRPRSNDPKPEEVMEFLLMKLKILNDKMDDLKSEMSDVKLKMRALQIAKDI